MTHDELRHRVAALVATVLAATLPGCAGDWPPGADWEPPTCTGTEWTPLAGLSLPDPPDWLGMYTAGVDSPADLGDELGTRCGGATDEAACTEAHAALEDQLADGSHLSSTTGDEVRGWVGREEVLGLLGEIDTADEAMVLAWAGEESVSCADPASSGQREAPEGGFDVVTTHYRSICSPLVRVRTRWHVEPDGAITAVDEDVIERSMACIGRRPPGLGPAPAGDASVAAWLARAAELEAAAVPAFERLAAELAALGAPADLVADARAAADEERDHVARMGGLAARFGGAPTTRSVAELPLRDLRALALDNAVEGCVREAWGAVLGAWQARAAADPAVAETLARVADDEVGHAALSLRIAAWVDRVADDALRSELRAAAAGAVAALRADVVAELPAATRATLGLPAPAEAAPLFDAFVRDLLAA